MNDSAHIAFIGGGNMARSLIGGLIADGYAARHITVAEPDPQRRNDLAAHFGVAAVGDNHQAAVTADAVLFAVKPQVVRAVAESLGPVIRERNAVAISVAAGVRLTDLERWLGHGTAVVRTMPNTPALVGCGTTALIANHPVTTAQRQLADSLLAAVGITLWLDDETQMDTVTAVSGSGPAYFFLLMEALEAAAIERGLAPETARLLTLQTAAGAAQMAQQGGESPAQLRRQVTSPGGTTEKALIALEADDLRGAVLRAVTAAAERAHELGNQLGEQ